MTEQKTGKTKDFPLSASAQKALAAYLSTRPDAQPADPLFPSRKHGRPLQRWQAWQILRDAAQAVGVTDLVGTHTLRKTFDNYTRLLGGGSRGDSADAQPQQPGHDAGVHWHSPGGPGCGVFGTQLVAQQLFLKNICVCSGSKQNHFAPVVVDSVDHYPIGLHMEIAHRVERACSGVIVITGGKRLLSDKDLDDVLQFGQILASPYHSLHIGLKPCRDAKR